MKKHILSILSVVLLAACTKDYQEQNVNESPVFKAVIENDAETKVHLNESLKSRWDAKDSVSIFVGNTVNQLYEFAGNTGDDSGNFSPVGTSGFMSGSKLSANYSVYPYQSTTSVSGDGTISFSFPAVQNYAEGSYGVRANTMVAVTENTSDMLLMYKNVCGFLRVSLYGDATIKSITLKGNNGEKIAGDGTITATNAGVPSVAMASTATETITIDCGDGVQLGTTASSATNFYFVIPPTEFTKGITITATGSDGAVFEKTTAKSISITRNKIQKMAALEYVGVKQHDTPNGELSFYAEEASTVALKKQESPEDITLEYLVKGADWAPYSIGQTITLAAGDSVCFRAGEGGNATFSKDDSNYYQFAMTGKVKASGNIMSLLDPTMESKTVTASAFICLFRDCLSLTSAPALPATTLASSCYSQMFKDCYNLTSAPELPATTLAEHCYEYMFQGTNLTTAPALSATSLVSSCYYGMFKNCRNLTKAPNLPAKVLGDYCYSFMFNVCPNLTTAPELPATTLTKSCYLQMFGGCTSLTTAPELPATTLAINCYSEMFYGCTKLASVPELPATTLKLSCYTNMFYGCTGLTSAPELPATSLTISCYYGMFRGCKGLTSAPALPATTLADGCYGYMFYGCTELTTAPELPSTSLENNCYNKMFYGCSKLNYVKMLATDVTGADCMNDWLYGVAATGTFVKNAAATWDITGASGVPEGWTVVNEPTVVDLGLSVKWASCNLGASVPEGYGDYYAWGATEPLYENGYAQESPQAHWKTNKSDGYCWYNAPYQTVNTTEPSSTQWTKYLGSTTSTYKDRIATDANALKTVLDPEDDAARVALGDKWRIPTDAEWTELSNTSNCSWTWTTINEVNGYKVQSLKTGYTDNWIFLPAPGYRYDVYLRNVGSTGYYWSSSLHLDSPTFAYHIVFTSKAISRSANYRNIGRSIRPVTN